MSAVVWCDLSATVCGAEYSGGMPASRVRNDGLGGGWTWHAWHRNGALVGLGGGYAKVGDAMAAAERQIDAAQAALSPDSAMLTGPAEAATAREAIEDAALDGTYVRPRPASPVNAALMELRSLGLDGTADAIEELPAGDRAAYCRMRVDRMRRGAAEAERLVALLTPDDGGEP